MRRIDTHKQNPCNEQLTIEVLDLPGAGGASHLYGIYGFHTGTNPSAERGQRDETCLKVLFQNGPIAEVGVNGVTQEALLAIVADRLEAFQSREYACAENAEALTHVRAALSALHSRTAKRTARGVEGTHTV